MSKAKGVTYYRISSKLEVKCWWEDTSYGFRHLAQLLDTKTRTPVLQARATYHNRTWERYTYQSVICKLIAQSDIRNKQATMKKIDDEALGRVEDQFKTLGTVMSLGDIFGSDKQEANSWKERMLKAGLGDLGLIMPEDWNELSEEEKESRLNKVVAEFTSE